MHLYAIAVGSNRPHGRHGRPAQVVEAAIAELDRVASLADASPVLLNAATGGAGRDFANAAVLVESGKSPPALLADLKAIERAFGRRAGRRWGPRVLDLDILAWSGGRWRERHLVIPHPRLGQRSFMLAPLASIAPGWRLAGPLNARHLLARLGKRGIRP